MCQLFDGLAGYNTVIGASIVLILLRILIVREFADAVIVLPHVN